MAKNSLFRSVALLAATAAAGFGLAEKAHADVTTSWSGAPRTNEEDRQFKVNGRVQYDIYDIMPEFSNAASNNNNYSGSFARRVFIGVEGRFTQNWRYNVKLDLVAGRGDSNGAAAGSVNQNPGDQVRLDDAYLEYAGSSYSIFIGQNNAVSHLEDRTSSNETPFNERSSIDQAFGFGKLFGISYLTNGGNWSAGVSVTTDSLNNPETLGVGEQIFYEGRATWAPIYQRTPEGVKLIHLGISARYRDNGSNGGALLAYSARPAIASNTAFGATINSGAIAGNDMLVGAEFAAQYNNFGMTAEYMSLKADRPATVTTGDPTFNGGYIDLFWSPTGESRNYSASDGSFGRISPLRTLGSDGGIGHVMLEARYDYLDLTNSSVVGGKQSGWVAGITWKPIAYVKFQMNYSDYNVDRVVSNVPVANGDGTVKAMTFRTQFDW